MRSDNALPQTSPTPGAQKARGRGGRPPLIDRDAIIRTGLEIGLEKLTLREVASRLGVTSQALYNHVRDRDHLVAMVGEAILKRLDIPADDGRPWQEWSYDYALALHRLLTAAPGFADIAIQRGHAMPALLEAHEVMLRVATRNGFDLITSMWVTRAVTEFVQSWVSRMEKQRAEQRATGVDYWNDVREIITVEGPDHFPLFGEVLRQPRALDADLRFEFALRSLISGLAATRSDG